VEQILPGFIVESRGGGCWVSIGLKKPKKPTGKERRRSDLHNRARDNVRDTETYGHSNMGNGARTNLLRVYE